MTVTTPTPATTEIVAWIARDDAPLVAVVLTPDGGRIKWRDKGPTPWACDEHGRLEAATCGHAFQASPLISARLEQDNLTIPASLELIRPSVLRYVCRDHHTPVNWRGKGCAECSTPTPRRAKRAPSPTPGTWIGQGD
jgi:hypothetical protein